MIAIYLEKERVIMLQKWSGSTDERPHPQERCEFELHVSMDKSACWRPNFSPLTSFHA